MYTTGMSPLESAIQLAVRAHTGQTDEDGMPHIVHCFEVFSRVERMFTDNLSLAPVLAKYSQEEVLAAAILHDTVEDSDVTLDLIERDFGRNVRDIVDSVTRRGEGDAKEFYRDFIYRAGADEGGAIVKVADLSHNLSRSWKIKKASWRNKLQFKYRIALSVLNDAGKPTWEQASAEYRDDGGPHYFVADPNGKRIEVSEAEFSGLQRGWRRPCAPCETGVCPAHGNGTNPD